MTRAPVAANGRSIVLVGLMGAGKTCVGRRLAKRLDLPFVDADDEIESAAGCTISEIFETYGEPAFRDVERRVIRRLVDGPPCVLATGGGAFMNDETRALILDRATAVWLRAELDLLVKRTAASRKGVRPLLDNDDPRGILDRLMKERYPVYAEAPVIVDTREESPDATVSRILAALAPSPETPA